MTRGTKIINDVLRSQAVVYVTTIATVAGFALTIWPGTIHYWSLAIPLIAFLGCIGYSLFVRIENQGLRDCAAVVHSVNHSYRDVLCSVLSRSSPSLAESYPEIERDTLEAACQRIASLYTTLISKRCVVTVKLIEVDAGKPFCTTLARSELNSERDHRHLRYEINTGANTAFDTAIKMTQGVSHFFSPDLIKDEKNKKYFNARGDWKRYYHSALVVPIRHVCYDDVGKFQACHELGFLTVDTLTRNRLNDGFHLEYLAAFADQMYNFMSLMRHKYQPKEPVNLEPQNKRAVSSVSPPL